MSEQIHSEQVQHPSAWYGRDLANDPSWLVHLTPQDLAEIDAAVRGVKAHGLALGEVGRGNFPLPTLAAKLARWLEEIRTGRGFVVVRGLNVADYTDDEVGLIFWALGAYLGDSGHAESARRPARSCLRPWPPLRRYRRAWLRDQRASAVPLRRLRPGRSAVSAPRQERRPEQHRQLGHAAQRDPAAAPGISAAAVQRLSLHQARGCADRRSGDGATACRCSAPRTATSARGWCATRSTPPASRPASRWSRLELAALDFLDSLAYDPAIHLDMDLQLGDMQLCNNLTILHSRTGFEDWPEPERRRHMIRLWLTFRERRPLADGFAAAEWLRTQPDRRGCIPDRRWRA